MNSLEIYQIEDINCMINDYLSQLQHFKKMKKTLNVIKSMKLKRIAYWNIGDDGLFLPKEVYFTISASKFIYGTEDNILKRRIYNLY